MAQVSMTVRLDADLKHSFESLCAQFGMSANTAMNVFARAVVQRGRIPFEIRGDKSAVLDDAGFAFSKIRELAEKGGLPDLTLDEINEEIKKYRAGE